MSVHNSTIIVLENVTKEQLDLIKVEVGAWFENLTEPDMEDYSEDNMLWHGLFNLCCDLELEGYEI